MDWVVVGEVADAFGIKGWVKIYSHTEPATNILKYGPLRLNDKEYKVISGRSHGTAVIAQLEGIADRDQALSLRSNTISVPRDRFPPPEPGQYYWADLIGLRVENQEGINFGEVSEVLATGANDVLIVNGDKERLIPLIVGQFVQDINLGERTMKVDWDADF